MTMVDVRLIGFSRWAAFFAVVWFLFGVPLAVFAEKPVHYVGPHDQAECFDDLEICHQVSAETCEKSDSFYTEHYNIVEAEKAADPFPISPTQYKTGASICGQWDDTSWDVLSNFFEPCYLQSWAQSSNTPYKSDKEKWGHYQYQDMEKWKIVSEHYLATEEPKFSSTLSETQACERFILGKEFGSASSYNQPITKAQCGDQMDECAALYSKCSISDDQNEFITEKDVMCSFEDKDGNFKPPFDVTQHCLWGIDKFGTGEPSEEFCNDINKFALGKECQCGSGEVSDYSKEGFQQSLGQCCSMCKTKNVLYGKVDTDCTAAVDLKLASGKAFAVEKTGECVGVNQTWVKYDHSSVKGDDNYFCGLCAQGKWIDKVGSVKVGDPPQEMECKGAGPKFDVKCENGSPANMGFMENYADPDAVPEKTLLKSVCSVCKTGTVEIKGDIKSCEKEIVLPSINAFPNPVAGKIESPQTFVAVLINSLLGILGSIALLLVVYGGFVWMTSAGDKNRVDAGRKTLLWAGIGLLTVFISASLVRFLFESLS